MGEPRVEELGINFSAVHAHGPSPVDGSQDLLSADFMQAVDDATSRRSCIFEVDGIPMNFMGGVMCEFEENHDGVPGWVACDAIVVRRLVED